MTLKDEKSKKKVKKEKVLSSSECKKNKLVNSAQSETKVKKREKRKKEVLEKSSKIGEIEVNLKVQRPKQLGENEIFSYKIAERNPLLGPKRNIINKQIKRIEKVIQKSDLGWFGHILTSAHNKRPSFIETPKVAYLKKKASLPIKTEIETGKNIEKSGLKKKAKKSQSSKNLKKVKSRVKAKLAKSEPQVRGLKEGEGLKRVKINKS